MASQNNEDKNLTVSTVYETLKSRNFLNDLYWDAVSSIKDKPTFKYMRETTDKIIKNKLVEIEKKPDISDRDKKRIVAEICSLTYAIDTVYSKILYMKLDKNFKEIIKGMLEDLYEGKFEEITSKIQVPCNLGESSNTITIEHKPQQIEIEKEPQHEKRKQNDITCSNTDSEHPKGITENKINYGTKKLSKKDIEDSIKASKTVTKKTGTFPLTSTPKLSPKKKLVDKESPTFSKNIVVTLKPENEDGNSDSESDISVGHLSIASVSSVHTSDLSSFDDEISIGSEDEDGSKKTLSLKYLQELCENGLPKLEKITNGIKPKEPTNASKQKKTINATKPKKLSNAIKSKEPTNAIKPKEPQKKIRVSPVKVVPNTPESTSSESSTTVTSKRVRKPNSKYSSSNIVCQSVKVKERKKQLDVSLKNTNVKDTNELKQTVERQIRPNEIDSSKGHSLEERKRIRSESSEPGTPNKMQKLDSAEKEKNEKSPSKRNDTTSVCKPQFPVRSLTSRKSAPLTLFSTS